MTEIFLIRHGEAEGNLYRRAQGQFDTPLTERGLAQIRSLTGRFADTEFTAAYSSDLSRAVATAEAAVGGRVPVTADPRLREVALGVWENRPWGNIEYEEPEQLRYFSFQPDKWSVPGSEPLADTQDRMEAALLEIAARHPGGTVAVGSHGMSIRALLARVMGVAPEEIRSVKHAENTAVARLLAEDGRLTLDYYNDYSHLPPELRTEGRRGWWRSESGGDSSNLRFTSFDTESGRERFLACYADAWRIAHGSLTGFSPESCWQGALYRASASPAALQAAWQGEEFAGLIALDERRGAREGVGWISFCYLAPAFRGRGLGVQLLGAAVSRCRELGRERLCLSVARDNPALGVYERWGFRPSGTEPGALEPLLRMEKDLRF